ncbi:MAG: DNA helicase RecG [Deltaproteobacteria bacterium]|nr:MAG: DNA helicase RecG [Deltaproteobacteria bacterium]
MICPAEVLAHLAQLATVAAGSDGAGDTDEGDPRAAAELAATSLGALAGAVPERSEALVAAAENLRAARSDLEFTVAVARAQRHVMACADDQLVDPVDPSAKGAEGGTTAGKEGRESAEDRRKARMKERRKEARAYRQAEDLARAKRGEATGIQAPIETLPGIGKVTGQRLRERGVTQVGDLIFTLPRRYDDERKVVPIGDLVIGERLVTAGIVASVRASGYRGRRRLEVVLEPLPEHPSGRHGALRLIWFRAFGLEKRFERGQRFRVSGVVDEYRGQVQIAHPDTSRMESGQEAEAGGVVPRYPDVGRVAPGTLARAIEASVARAAGGLIDSVPASVREAEGLPSLTEALRALHRPSDDIDDEYFEALNARTTPEHARLAFEEFFLLELALHHRRAIDAGEASEALVAPEAPVARARAALPFTLTTAQARVVDEIGADLGRDRPMRRILQGDVGSGKTAVAMLAAARAVAAGAQVAFMAPTELLAEQHFRNFEGVAKALGLRLALVVGGARAAHRRKVKKGLREGTIDVAVGTHALLTESLEFHRLRLVIVDEQHRFGVGQRLRLVQKGEGTEGPISPHLLVMTATPIPRSLALALYGDLDASILDELPPGRIPPTTRAYGLEERDEALRQLGRALAKGGQAYVICPLVEESEEMDLRDATTTFDEMKKRFPEVPVGLVHGRMGSEERNAAMAAFTRGDVRLLVSTTVVEVGVDVSAANVVLIEHAERFGLAQLHQLRGRVGRGGQKSACLLVHDATTDEAQARVKIMCETSDGFRIAEEDLAIRGPGELFGRRQSGLPGFRFGDLRRDLALLGLARDHARRILEDDPNLEDPAHAGARAALTRLSEGPLKVVREEAG